MRRGWGGGEGGFEVFLSARTRWACWKTHEAATGVDSNRRETRVPLRTGQLRCVSVCVCVTKRRKSSGQSHIEPGKLEYSCGVIGGSWCSSPRTELHLRESRSGACAPARTPTLLRLLLRPCRGCCEPRTAGWEGGSHRVRGSCSRHYVGGSPRDVRRERVRDPDAQSERTMTSCGITAARDMILIGVVCLLLVLGEYTSAARVHAHRWGQRLGLHLCQSAVSKDALVLWNTE